MREWAWSAAESAALDQMWRSGLSTQRIADALGKSKGAVIGRAHRLGLPARRSPIKRSGITPSPSPPRPPAGTRGRRRVLRAREQLPARPVPAVPILGARECQWPLWDGRGDPRYGQVCGCRSVRGSYCAEHAARAYVCASAVEWEIVA